MTGTRVKKVKLADSVGTTAVIGKATEAIAGDESVVKAKKKRAPLKDKLNTNNTIAILKPDGVLVLQIEANGETAEAKAVGMCECSDLIDALRSEESISTPILPRHTRCYSTIHKGGSKKDVYLLEIPPTLRVLQHSIHGELRLWFPYHYFIVKASSINGDTIVGGQVMTFFGNRPLKNMNDYPQSIALNNVETRGIICFGENTIDRNHAGKDSSEVINDVVQTFFSSTFNNHYDEYLLNLMPTELAGKNAKEFYANWQKKAEDPISACSFSWRTYNISFADLMKGNS